MRSSLSTGIVHLISAAAEYDLAGHYVAGETTSVREEVSNRQHIHALEAFQIIEKAQFLRLSNKL
jgi:hypothetical protein